MTPRANGDRPPKAVILDLFHKTVVAGFSRTIVKSLDTRNRSRSSLEADVLEWRCDDQIRASALVGMAGQGVAGGRRAPSQHRPDVSALWSLTPGLLPVEATI